MDGDVAGGSFLCGNIAGMVTKRESAKAIVDDIVSGAEKLLKSAPALLS